MDEGEETAAQMSSLKSSHIPAIANGNKVEETSLVGASKYSFLFFLIEKKKFVWDFKSLDLKNRHSPMEFLLEDLN